MVFLRFRKLCKFLDEHWQKYRSPPSENKPIHLSLDGSFIILFSSHIMAILHVSQHYPKHASSHRDILHAPGAPRELYHSTGAICCTCLASVHSESMRRPFPIHIRSGGFPLLCFNSDHHLLIHGYTMWIMRCAASCLDSLSSVQIVCIKLFPAEYNASARCFLVTVSSSGSSGALKQSHIV